MIFKIFNIRFFNTRIYSINKFQFLTNCQNRSCSVMSKLGIINKLVHFLKGLRSWAIIQVNRKKLAEDYNTFSSICWTSVIPSSVLKIGQMLKTSR